MTARLLAQAVRYSSALIRFLSKDLSPLRTSFLESSHSRQFLMVHLRFENFEKGEML